MDNAYDNQSVRRNPHSRPSQDNNYDNDDDNPAAIGNNINVLSRSRGNTAPSQNEGQSSAGSSDGIYSINATFKVRMAFRAWQMLRGSNVSKYDDVKKTYIKSNHFDVIELGDTDWPMSQKIMEKSIYKYSEIYKGLRSILSDHNGAEKDKISTNIELGVEIAKHVKRIIKASTSSEDESKFPKIKIFFVVNNQEKKDFDFDSVYGILIATIANSKDNPQKKDLDIQYAISHPLSQISTDSFSEGGLLSMFKDYPFINKYRLKGVGQFLVSTAVGRLLRKYDIQSVSTSVVNARSAAIATKFGALLSKPHSR